MSHVNPILRKAKRETYRHPKHSFSEFQCPQHPDTGCGLSEITEATLFQGGTSATQFPSLDYISQKHMRRNTTSGANLASTVLFRKQWFPEVGSLP